MFLQGLYYHEGTSTDKPEKVRNKKEFIGIVADRLMGNYPPEDAARAVFKVIENSVTAGEVEDIKSVLPAEIRELWAK